MQYSGLGARRRNRIRIGFLIFAALSLALEARAQVPDRTLILDDGSLKVRMHLQAGINAVSERNLFWDLSDVFAATAYYDPNKDWVEYFVKPRISFTDEADGFTGYGKASLVASYTQNADAYDVGDTGRITLEEAYLGGRMCIRKPMELDVSIGPRELKLGTGMLIANGGSSGER